MSDLSPHLDDVHLVERVTGCRLVAIVRRDPDGMRSPELLSVELAEEEREGDPERLAADGWAWRTIVSLCRRIAGRAF